MLGRASLARLRNLRDAKHRASLGLYLIEGTRLVEEAVRAQAPLVAAWRTKHYGEAERETALLAALQIAGCPCTEITKEQLGKFADTETSPGIAATVRLPSVPVKFDASDFWIYCDQIRDPGNLGTILRTADWFGFRSVALSKGCVDPFNPKVVRGGMGAHFRLTLVTDVSLQEIRDTGFRVVAADATGGAMDRARLVKGRWCLLVGSEGFGVSEVNRPLVEKWVAIPGCGGAESLNVAVAVGILLYLLSTARTTPGPLYHSP